MVNNFTYNNTVPATNNNPSNDQPQMLGNTNSIHDIIAVDHVGFNANNGGYHLQVTFNSENVPGSLPTDPTSILYTDAGTASTVAQLFYKNANGTFQISPIKAWASVAIGPSPTFTATFTQNVNVSSVTRTSQGRYTIILTSNATSSDDYAVTASVTLSSPSNTVRFVSYAITSTTTFDLWFFTQQGVLADVPNGGFSFQVLQL